MNEYEILNNIIELCLWLDNRAHETYENFAQHTQDEELKEQWLRRSYEETTHILFWEKALLLSRKKQLPLVLRDSMEVLGKMQKTCDSLKLVLGDFKEYSKIENQMSLAFMLESFMLNPSFLIMFHDYGFINRSINEQYEDHILAFIDMMKSYHGSLNLLHVDLFCENLLDIYSVTRQYLESSLRDIMTGLYNRRGFMAEAKALLSLATRNKLEIAIIMIDLDNLKKINDSFGHPEGDKVIQATASILNSVLRSSSVIGRYGGDEFIVCTDIDDLDSLKKICERITQNVEKQSEELSDHNFTVSVGAVKGANLPCTHYELSLAKIISDADKKLLKAKSKGKNTYAT